MHHINQAVHLLKSYLKGDIHPDSNEKLQQLLTKYPDLLDFVKSLDNPDDLEDALDQYKSFDDEKIDNKGDHMLQDILSRIKEERKPQIISFKRVAVIAASVAVLFFAAFYVLGDRFVGLGQTTLQSAASFSPGTNKAILTTSDGKQLELSSSYGGIIVADRLLYEDGSVVWEEKALDQNMTLTLATPRGGQYQVSLSDGTKVWLNAESKLHYPRVFSDSIRMVEMEGEAYFEVAKDAQKPFIVKTKQEKIEVLGTHFNVNAYTEESTSAVALLEGKVKVSLGDRTSKVLQPGQQSLVKEDAIQVQNIDVAESIAWKNGEFMFNNESLSSVMRKLARWYDIEVEIASDVQDISIWGSISRYDNFSEVLQVIKMTDDNIQFKIEGRRVKLMK
ncbi:DUF4974 domain-containing protein [Parapedobacter sp. SGR-10]|uniref:FecR family protein n=1 Tax=Parapedobacter sp. SGR-10 TaxID=2710879 RepID=UPI0013D7AA91|nr:FecR family protein [Parapedobacter sp. SGR-10]NGF55190.1 DUF4974 domain-containing protein [Parapedobacter sp. SGR-10]